MNEYKIIDTPWNMATHAHCLKDIGIETVIRYYDLTNSHRLPKKRLELIEAQALIRAGINIVVVYQAVGDKVSDFSYDKGRTDGCRAFTWAREKINQPAGSAIYFAVDYNATAEDITKHVIPYFCGVKEIFEKLSCSGPTYYKVGAYGSGLVINSLYNHSPKLCEYRWLSMSSRFRGSQDALHMGKYEMKQIYPPARLCGLSVDNNVKLSEDTDIGSFVLKEELCNAEI